MLLAAGFGRRLVPITLRQAKPTLPFLNRPLLLRQLDYLEAAGVDEVVVNVNHRPESILKLLAGAEAEPAGAAEGPFRIGRLLVHVSPEAERQGTSGGLKMAAPHFADRETFICLNSDMVCEVDLAAALDAHRAGGDAASLVLVPADASDAYTPVAHDGKQIRSFGPRHEKGESWDLGIFTGIHILEPAVLERLPHGPSEFLPALYQPMIREGSGPGAIVSTARWEEVGTARRYIQGQVSALDGGPFAGHRPWAAGEAGEITAGDAREPLTLVGNGCRIGAGARLQRGTIVGDGVIIEENARLSRCILLDGARIGARAELDETVVGPDTVVPTDAVVRGAVLQAGGEPGTLTADEAAPAGPWRGLWRVDN
jgi:mannose-1-phosphate guanylyltransferase